MFKVSLPAWVLGAAVAPTDTTALGALARALPHRNVTLPRAESLINDGTAPVVYGLAVAITVGEEQLSVPHICGMTGTTPRCASGCWHANVKL